MSVGVVLTMREPVTIRELRHFLSFVTADTDVDEDLREGFWGEDAVALLVIPRPAPYPEGEREHSKDASDLTTKG